MLAVGVDDPDIRVAAALPLGCACVRSREKQCRHDTIASTYVVPVRYYPVS